MSYAAGTYSLFPEAEKTDAALQKPSRDVPTELAKEEYAYALGKMSNEEAAAIGCNMAFSPVCDILLQLAEYRSSKPGFWKQSGAGSKNECGLCKRGS